MRSTPPRQIIKSSTSEEGRFGARANGEPVRYQLPIIPREVECQGEPATPRSLNLHTATIPELMTLPGVNLPLAREIVSARAARGYFQSVEDLQRVEGIPASLVELLRTMREQMRAAAPFKRQ